MKISSVLLLGSFLASVLLHAESTPSKALLVLSKGDRTLAIVDPSSLRVVARMPSGPSPHEVIASTDGRFAYISNYGAVYNTLAVIDLVGQTALPPVDLGPLRGTHGLAFVGGKVWFTTEAAKAIGSYDPATKKVDWVLGTGQNRTHMIFVSEDLKRIVTTNISSATVTIIEKSSGPPQGDWDETVVAVGRGAEGFDVSPNGKEIWVANAQDSTISIINVVDKKVIQTLAANIITANRLKFTPDGRLVFISAVDGSDLTIFDAATRREVKRVKIGHGGEGVLMQPDGLRAYVSCTPDGYVAVIDVKSLEVIGHIDAGKQPDGLAWAIRR